MPNSWSSTKLMLSYESTVTKTEGLMLQKVYTKHIIIWYANKFKKKRFCWFTIVLASITMHQQLDWLINAHINACIILWDILPTTFKHHVLLTLCHQIVLLLKICLTSNKYIIIQKCWLKDMDTFKAINCYGYTTAFTYKK